MWIEEAYLRECFVVSEYYEERRTRLNGGKRESCPRESERERLMSQPHECHIVPAV